MEDFIQVLIYLIIIISFLSSLFRKKEKEPPRPVPQKKPEPQEYDSYKTNSENEYETGVKAEEEESDIFREITDLFKTEFPPVPEPSNRKTKIEQRTESIPTSSEHSSEEYKRTESEHVSYERETTSFEHVPTYSEHIPELSWQKQADLNKRKKQKIDAAIEKQADFFRKLLEQKSGAETNIYRKKISRTLKNPQSLKEYFLISEIIGRPKALEK